MADASIFPSSFEVLKKNWNLAHHALISWDIPGTAIVEQLLLGKKTNENKYQNEGKWNDCLQSKVLCCFWVPKKEKLHQLGKRVL